MLAYLDAGSGGIIVQMVLGGLAGVSVFFKMNWHRIRAKFARSSTE